MLSSRGWVVAWGKKDSMWFFFVMFPMLLPGQMKSQSPVTIWRVDGWMDGETDD